MNTDPTTAEQQQVIATAAANFTPPEPRSHMMLTPHRESIATLRSKGASYRAIVKILGKVNIRVSLDTLSRFCRETIEQKPVRKGRRHTGIPPASKRAEAPMSEPAPPPAAPDSPAPAKDAKAAEPAAARRGRGRRSFTPSSRTAGVSASTRGSILKTCSPGCPA